MNKSILLWIWWELTLLLSVFIHRVKRLWIVLCVGGRKRDGMTCTRLILWYDDNHVEWILLKKITSLSARLLKHLLTKLCNWVGQITFPCFSENWDWGQVGNQIEECNFPCQQSLTPPTSYNKQSQVKTWKFF